MNTQDFLAFFRQAAPYIHGHRGKTFVIHFEADFDNPQLIAMLHDCALLHSLGIRLILVPAIRQQIERNLAALGMQSQFCDNRRITEKAFMPAILNAAGSLQLAIEAALSMGAVNSPMQDAAIKISSGNYLAAKPLGILNGVDFGMTGAIRKIHTDTINAHLSTQGIVLMTSIGFSNTGECYNLNSDEIAAATAAAIKADKLIYLSAEVENYLNAQYPHQLSPAAARHSDYPDAWLCQRLNFAAAACEQGIRRVHLIDQDREGALLQELFTRDGKGIMVTADHYDELRQANPDDINHIIALIRPLEEQGILVPRSRETLENDIQHFYVLMRDNSIIACAALYPYAAEKTAELACLAVAPEYRQHRRADYLLSELEKRGRELGLNSLFLLTTQTGQWFEERGFSAINISDLPQKKQDHYNRARNSRPYRKTL